MSSLPHLPENFVIGQAGHVAAHIAVNDRVNDLEDAIADLQNSAGDATDPVTAVTAALQSGVHTGLLVSPGTSTTALNLSVQYPVLPLAAGAAVPANTPANTIILRIG